MTYFLPSFFQKRILRYALSRLELLDTDDLALDKLDIAWGKRSTVELRDVGVHLKKLASVLKLPQTLVLLKARISLLRLTIPADLYRTGILVEVEGVDLLVETRLGERKGNEHTRSGHRVQKSSKGVKADRARSTRQSLIHDPGGQPSLSSDDESDDVGEKEDGSKQLPKTVDLAQSFLQAEPQEEKEELEAAIVNSHYLGQSSQAIELGDEAAALGVGNALSLPGFLADFLKGVGDRLQLKVKNVRLDLKLDLEIPLEPSEANISTDGSETVTIRLSIGSVGLQGTTAFGPEQDHPDGPAELKSNTVDEPPRSLQQGIRCIQLDNIQVMLVSDASLFANLSRFVSPSSPVTTHVSSDKRPGGRKLASTSRSNSTVSSTAHELTQPTKTHDRAQPIHLSSDLAASHATNYSERFSSAGLDDVTGEALGQLYASSLGESRYQDSVLADSFYPESEAEEPKSKNFNRSDRLVESPRPRSAKYQEIEPHALAQRRKGDFELDDPEKLHLERVVPSPLHSPSGKSFSSSPHDSLDPAYGVNLYRAVVENERGDYPSSSREISQSTLFSSYDSDSVSLPSDDLTQSRIFSQEEAESVYMSAISHVSTQNRAEDAAITDEWKSSSDIQKHSRDTKSVGEGAETDHTATPILESSQDSTRSPGLGDFPVSRNYERSAMANSTRGQTNVLGSPTSSPTAKSESTLSSRILQPGQAMSQDSQDSSSRSENSLIILKRFISIDSITLKLPQETARTGNAWKSPRMGNVEKESLVSTAGNTPLRFNQLETTIPENTTEKPTQGYTKKTPHQSPIADKTEKTEGPISQPVSVEIGFMEVLGDVGLTKLTILIIQQHMELFQTEGINDTDHKGLNPALAHVKIKVSNISWKFLDLVKGFTSSDGKAPDPVPSPVSFHANAEVLLKAAIDNLQVAFRGNKSSTNTILSMGKVSFGYLSEHILSFDSGLKMRESTRDILAPVDNDLVLTINKTNGSTKIDLTTLPLHISLDLRRLDDTFGWFGGFSSILGLGSSMMSTVTIVKAKSGGSHSSKPSRGVHFETPVSTRSAQASQPPAQKITARIGSLALVLQGANCTLRLESTAMKVVSRVEGIGLQIDKLKFTGPYLKQDVDGPSISANLTNIRMEYLSTPKELDLARLLALLSPSKDKYEQDDDILLDTLLRQRRQGGVVRMTIEALKSRISKLEHLQLLLDMAEELKKLSTVTKYLPEDDRPGILTLGLIRDLQCDLTMDDSIGVVSVGSKNLELAHVSLPSLTAFGINSIKIHRNHTEELLGETLPQNYEHERLSPMIMTRFIGNEMEPVVKVKILNARVEYHVSTLMAMMGLSEDISTENIVSEMISSVVTLTNRNKFVRLTPKLSSQVSSNSEKPLASSKPMKLDISIRDSIIGLNPRNSTAKGLIVLTNAQLNGVLPKEDESSATFEVKKASLMIIDDQKNLIPGGKSMKGSINGDQGDQLDCLLDSGFVSVSYISSAKITLKTIKLGSDESKCHDIEIRDDLFVLESCADSTQTLLTILNGLKPPMPPSTELKYRTEVVPVEDMLASFSGDAFAAPVGSDKGDYTSPLDLDEGDMVEDDVPQNLEFVSSFCNPDPENFNVSIANSMLDDELESLANPPVTREIGDKILLQSFQEQYQVAPGRVPLEFQEDHFGSSSTVGGTAHRWDTKQNTYGLTNELEISGSPLRLRVRDVHIIWNLFDGYDWQHTRDTISKAVAEVEIKAAERLSRHDRRKSVEADDEEDSVIGDFLFNSIYIGIPANRDPKDLARQVSRNLDDLASETESYATSSVSGSPNRQGHLPRVKGKKLQLTRSKYHKMTFELKGVSADLVVFPPDTQETQSSIDIRVQDLEIFDHVPTSTWKKFATYMHDAGERESGTSMVHLEILNVKPVPNLAASEIILKATILPLRLHVDQDALDFITRFFEFKDDSLPSQSLKSEAPFLQRVEVKSVQVKLDFKPKRVDYAGLRSGRTNEFMNFFILDRADMVLRHVIIYGVSGFDKLGKTLNDIWMPDIKQNQLPGVLAGLAPVRSLVNVGGGVRDLVVIPIKEYRKDGRLVRSFQKGALAFAKTTTSELVKLGAKLAIGTQTVLQGAEDLLNQPGQQRSDVSAGWEDAELEDEEKKRISLYADQPVGVVQGLRGAYASLERDLLVARDAIIAMPGEVMESGTAGGAARAVLRGAPTVILRPAMGVTKAVGQTLMGATNSLDPGNRRRIEDKYKRH